MPWWTALLIAVTGTAIGFGIDAGHKELTHVFAGFYIAGCVAAVLAVRQSGMFTAVIQPPLILFCAVPGAYWLFHGAKVGNLKDLLINCGYPLIERFPLMLGTAGGVLLIGLVSWYFGMSQRATARQRRDDPAAATTAAGRSPSSAASRRKLNSCWASVRDDDDDLTDEASAGHPKPRPQRGAQRARPVRANRGARALPACPAAAGRRARTRRRAPAAQAPGHRPRDFDPAEPPRRPRRPRPRDPDLRGQPPGKSAATRAR